MSYVKQANRLVYSKANRVFTALAQLARTTGIKAGV